MFRRILNAGLSATRRPSIAASVPRHEVHNSSQRVDNTHRARSVHSINRPKAAELRFSLSDADVTKILNGFHPRDMEQRWFILSDGPDDVGNIVSHLYRSWTGYEMYRLKITAPRFGSSGGSSSTARAAEEGEDGDAHQAHVTEVIWESREDYNAYGGSKMGEREAKRAAISICRGILGCKLEDAPKVVGWD
ncbi:hypothetical protein GQ607_007500 [Colletotrichum asianum]|uniref:Uncharacterized protein n=1 Tax=Colletotrichum asianum TaxID=702518 RepID=A0A8H3WIP3_9PEZI|nr:hypothetical protein GQ607_007500 [Colletotrichum asianum]